MKPSIITLLTDFGTQDYFVGAMKGAILSIDPAALIVDITHEIPPQDIRAAAFNLLAGHASFPGGTIHVAVVDPGVGSSRRALLVECDGQFFVGPDNGIFSWVCEQAGNWRAICLTNEEFFRRPVSATFHGRDIFAPVAAALSRGIAIQEFGEEVGDIVRLESLEPRAGDGRIEGAIIHIDRFGNCITNLTPAHVREDALAAGAKLVIGDREVKAFRHFFAEPVSDQDQLFCFFGSAGFLEIAAPESSAQMHLQAQRGQPVALVSDRGD